MKKTNKSAATVNSTTNTTEKRGDTTMKTTTTTTPAVETTTEKKTAEKLTKKQWLNEIKKIVEAGNSERKAGALKFINHEIELLEKKVTKKSGSGNTENERLKAVILEVLSRADRYMTVADLLVADDRLATWKDGDTTKITSGQKLTALLKQLKDAGKVVREEEKKKAFFSIPVEKKMEINVPVDELTGETAEETAPVAVEE